MKRPNTEMALICPNRVESGDNLNISRPHGFMSFAVAVKTEDDSQSQAQSRYQLFS